MSASYIRKYGVATVAATHVEIPIIKAGSLDFAVAADWTPAAGDVKISKDGAAPVNIGTLPTHAVGSYNGWRFVFTAAELQCKKLTVLIVDSATKAIEDQFFSVETYGHASAMVPIDFSDTVRMGLTALANAAAGAAGGLPTDSTGKTSFNDLSAAQVNAECDTALADYDGPTKAEMDSGFAALNDLSAAQVNAECDQALIDYDSGNGVAKEVSVLGLQNNTRFTCIPPSPVLIPASGDNIIKLTCMMQDSDGNPEDPDVQETVPLIAIKARAINGAVNKTAFFDDEAGTTPATASSTYGSPYIRMVKDSTGVFYTYYKLPSTEGEDNWTFTFKYAEQSVEFVKERHWTVAESDPATVTLEDSVANKNIIQAGIEQAEPIESNLKQINDDSVVGNVATLTLKHLNIQNNAGAGLYAQGSGSNAGIHAVASGTGHGIEAEGNATGHGFYSHGKIGIYALGGKNESNGDGIKAEAGGIGHGIHSTADTQGDGIYAYGGSSDGNGMYAAAPTDGVGIAAAGITAGIDTSASGGAGILTTGGGTGHGIEAKSGAGATGDGIHAESQATNGKGMYLKGAGTDEGLYSKGGATGKGAVIEGGDTSGDGLHIRAANSGMGCYIAAAGAGDGLRVEAGTNGDGAEFIGGSVSGHGINANAQASGNGLNLLGANAEGLLITGNSNKSGVKVVGAGTGHGIEVESGAGATGDGMHIESKATAGHGLYTKGKDGDGIHAEGDTNGKGIYALGGADAPGMHVRGGSTATVKGMVIESQGGNSQGLYIKGIGSAGNAVYLECLDGSAIYALNTNNNNPVIRVEAQGNADAVKFDAQGTGHDLVADRLEELFDKALSAQPTAGSMLGDLTEDDGGTQRFTANALEEAPGGGGISVEEIWDHLLSNITVTGSVGKLLKDDIDAAISTRATPAQVNAECDQALADYDGPTKTEMDAGFAALNDVSAAQVNAECDQAIADAFTFTTGNVHAHQKARDDLGLKTQEKADVNAEVDQSLIDYDSGNGVAKEQSVLSIQNNTRFVASLPTYMLIPTSSSNVYKLTANFYDSNGNMEDPDSQDVGLDLDTADGTDKNALLFKDFAVTTALDASGIAGHKKLERTGVGQYYCYVKIASTETENQFVYNFALDENSVRLYYTRSNKVVDSAPGTTTLADSAANKDIIAEALKERDVSGTGAVSGSVYDDIMDNIDDVDASVAALNNLSSAEVEAACEQAITDSEPIDANLTQIDGLATNGNNATLNLKKLNIVNDNGDALVAQAGTTGTGIKATGAGSGGNGMELIAGTNGQGLYAKGGTSNGNGIWGRAPGVGHGIKGEGGGSGHGMYLESASGDGLNAKGLGAGKDIDAAEIDNIQSTANDIEADTQDIQTQIGTAGAGLTDLGGMSTGMKAEVNAEADQALADYDPPTKAEMDAGFAALNDLSAAQVNAECDQALADYDGPTHSEMTAEHNVLEAEHAALAVQNANIEADTQDIQSRIPAALVGGRMDSNVSALNNDNPAAVTLQKAVAAVFNGIVGAGTHTTLKIAASDITGYAVDAFNGKSVNFKTGPAAGASRRVIDYENSTGAFTFDTTEPLPAIPTQNDKFSVT